jgi:hypothetical protein
MATEKMDFRCNNDSGNPLFFACQGGMNTTCKFDDQIGYFCDQCPEGYTHNLIGPGKFYDCALPERFLEIYFIISTIFCAPPMVRYFVLFVFALKEKANPRHAPSKMHAIGVAAYFAALWAWLLVLSTYVDGGTYLRSQVFFLLMNGAGTWASALAAPALFLPIARLAGKGKFADRFKWVIYGIYALQNLFLMVFVGVFSSKHAYDSNPGVDNYGWFVLLFESASFLCLMNSAAIIFGLKLRKIIIRMLENPSKDEGGVEVTVNKEEGMHKSTSTMPIQPSASTKDLERRKRQQNHSRIKKQLVIIIAVNFAFIIIEFTLFAFLIVWYYYSSFPYLWIMWLLITSSIMSWFYTIPFFLDSSRLLPWTSMSSSNQPQGLPKNVKSGTDGGPPVSVERTIAPTEEKYETTDWNRRPLGLGISTTSSKYRKWRTRLRLSLSRISEKEYRNDSSMVEFKASEDYGFQF